MSSMGEAIRDETCLLTIEHNGWESQRCFGLQSQCFVVFACGEGLTSRYFCRPAKSEQFVVADADGP